LPLPASEFERPTKATLARIGAAMLWPDVPEKWRDRERAVFSRAAASVLDELPADHPTTAGSMRDLVKLAGQAVPLASAEAEDRPRHRQGRIVGAIVLDVLGAKAVRPYSGASLQRAKARIARHHDLSVARIDKADWWPRFKPVAHLWAAHLLIHRQGAFPVRLERFQDFVACACQILDLAGAKAGQAASSYLTADQCWRFSSDLPMPAGRVRFEIAGDRPTK
jgi:hypothetical protein